MNILIWGQQATGKSTVATALKSHYESIGIQCQVIEEEIMLPSLTLAHKARQKAWSQIRKTRGNPNIHTIVVTRQLPVPPNRDGDTITAEDFDYFIKCGRR